MHMSTTDRGVGMIKRIACGVVAGAVALGTTGIAIGQAQSGDEAPVASPPTPIAADAPMVPPPGPGNYGAAHQTSRAALRAHLEPAGPEYLVNVEWNAARSFAIPGTRLRGWTFQQPSKRCLALPDPIAEGYAVTCNSPEEIAAGKATIVIVAPVAAHAPNLVGALTASSGTASIVAPRGTAAKVERTGDVYVGTVPAGSRLVTASASQVVDPPTNEVLSPEAAGVG